MQRRSNRSAPNPPHLLPVDWGLYPQNGGAAKPGPQREIFVAGGAMENGLSAAGPQPAMKMREGHGFRAEQLPRGLGGMGTVQYNQSFVEAESDSQQ